LERSSSIANLLKIRIMLTDTDLQQILSKSELTDTEMKMVVEKYIYDRKGVEVDINLYKNIDHPLFGSQIAISDLQLLNKAYNKAATYYAKK